MFYCNFKLFKLYFKTYRLFVFVFFFNKTKLLSLYMFTCIKAVGVTAMQGGATQKLS